MRIHLKISDLCHNKHAEKAYLVLNKHTILIFDNKKKNGEQIFDQKSFLPRPIGLVFVLIFQKNTKRWSSIVEGIKEKLRINTNMSPK